MPSKAILGISLQEETFESVLKKGRDAWTSGTRLRIATVNPEFLVAADGDALLKQNLQKAEVQVVDGVGLWLVLKFRGWRGIRITGVDLVKQFLALAETENRGVLVILKRGGLSSKEAVEKALKQEYPALLLSVCYQEEVPSTQADLILITLGAPEQEYLAETFQQGIVMGVGGAIDFLTGTQKRAPKFLQIVGLEWFWRLLLQPKRIKRIWNAVVVFPFLVIKKS